MDVLTSSWFVLNKEWGNILSLLCVFLLGGVIVFLWLRILFNDRLTPGEYFVLSMGGAIFPLALGILITLLLNLLFAIRLNFVIICLFIFVVSYLAFHQASRKDQTTSSSIHLPWLTVKKYRQVFTELTGQYRQTISAWILVLIFLGSLYVRLAFISGLIAPLYFDSATHYSIIQGLISKIETSSLASIHSLVSGYYHLGYHALIASFSLAINMDVKDAMLIVGQIFLAIIPLPLFFILRQETGMDTPGIFMSILAGWGWSMPAYSLNWGKYPALSSILSMEFVLCLLYLALRSSRRDRRVLVVFSGFFLLLSTFIHTRSFVPVFIVLLSVFLGLAWHRLSRLTQAIIFGSMGIGLAALIYVIQLKPVLSLVFQPYQQDGRWMLLLVLLLSPLALKKFPVATFSTILSILFLLGSIFIPINQLVPGYDVQTLLDRLYIEMLLFVPLAFLGGLGYAGLVRTLEGYRGLRGTRQSGVKALAALLLFGAVALNATQYRFFPSACCQFLKIDDAVALDWMDKRLPPDANILISSSEAFVLDSPTSTFPGTDAGAWITPLIHRKSSYLAYQADFNEQETLSNLCKNKISYIYVGSNGESFSLLQIQRRPEWYEMLLLLPEAQVFKIAGCR